MSDHSGSGKSLEEIGMDELRDELTDVIARANFADERFVITRAGRRIGGLIGLDDLNRLLKLDAV